MAYRVRFTTPKIIFLTLLISVVSAGLIGLLQPQKTEAISGSDFQAGRIIDDGVFFNPSGFSAADIQRFLDAKVPNCDTNGTAPYAGTTAGEYGTSKGYPPPYICLKDYRADTVSKPAEAGLCNGYTATNQSAANIIYSVAQSCGINPKVLIVLLQKEQGLVTDSWPWSKQYQKATGFGCPDSAPCDEQYYGFFNQVYSAARQFKKYATSPGSYNYVALQNNNILFSPASGCSRGTVFIQNAATAALYNYTPYQPNQAALANLYGNGDGCSSYGNRNFWRYFNDWFGSTFGETNSAQFYGQSVYPTMIGGDSATAYLMYKNTGFEPWYDSSSAPVGVGMTNLATTNSMNRSSIFSAGWVSASRPAINFAAVYEADGTTLASNQHVAQPGQIIKYQFTFTVPTNAAPGVYREWFQPVLDGVSNWSIGGQAWLEVTVLPTTFHATLQSTTPTTFSLTPGQTQSVTIRYKSTGTGTIKDSTGAPSFGPFGNLATSTPMNRQDLFDYTWYSNRNRPAINFAAVYEADGTTLASNQHVVRPGQIFTYDLRFAAHPGTPNGTYREWFQPVLDGAQNWDMAGQAFVDITLTNSSYQLQYYSQSSYPTIKVGNTGTGYFLFKNTGTGPVFDSTSIVAGRGMANLATTDSINRSSVFGSTWASNKNRPAINFAAVYEADGTTLASNQHVAQPGQIIKYQFTFTVPTNAAPGVYREWFQPVLDGAQNWDVGGRVFLDVVVTP